MLRPILALILSIPALAWSAPPSASPPAAAGTPPAAPPAIDPQFGSESEDGSATRALERAAPRRPWSVALAVGGGLVRQAGSAPPLCCGERDTWNGGQIQAEVRGAVQFGEWFALTADVGAGYLWSGDANQPERYTHGWLSAHLVPELRVIGDDWRGRLGLGAGLGPKDYDAVARLGADRRLGPTWMGLEYRAVQSGLALSTHTLLFVVWY